MFPVVLLDNNIFVGVLSLFRAIAMGIVYIATGLDILIHRLKFDVGGYLWTKLINYDFTQDGFAALSWMNKDISMLREE